MQQGEGARVEGNGPEAPGDLAPLMLDMLQVRASDVLPGWLAQRIVRRHPQARARVLRIFPGGAARSRSVPRYAVFSMDEPMLQEPPTLIGIDAPVLEAIRSAEPCTVQRGEAGKRLLLTLGSGGEVRYVIDVTAPADARCEDELHLMARLASRYFERLTDAETDPLTRLANRRAFHAQLDAGLRRWTASGRPWFFAVLDIDHFKKVNDEFGHLYGDEILVRFAALLRQTFRAGDLLYRFGGEEFVMIFGVAGEEDGALTLERVRAAVEGYEFPGVGRVTVSMGFTRITDASTPVTTLIDRADKALYFAKGNGRNRVAHWEALVAAGKLEPSTPNRDVTLF
jgi:diguanylate cyclase (GGDEF)-like protein